VSTCARAVGALVLTYLAGGGAHAGAQTPAGSVRGVVVDPTRAPLAHAPMQLVDEDTGLVRTAESGAAGEFSIAQVPPGRYRLEVAAAGYKRFVQRLDLRVNQELRALVTLEVGPLSEEVSVVAHLTDVRRGSPAAGTVVDHDQISRLPLDGRNFLELALLVPGAAPAAQGSASSVRGDFAFTANGAREDANSFLLDGVDNLDPTLNTPALRPPVDAIREFEVLTSTYEAAFGGQAGAQVNVASKSGSNAVHGTGYGFFRTRAFDARNYFAPADEPAPAYARRQFGGSIGGPLRRGRTFYFGDYEGTRRREGITRVTTVPTAAERAGDFSRSLRRAPVDPFTGQPFPSNRIPEASLNPIGLAIAALYPEPNRARAVQNHVASPAERDHVDHGDVKVTHLVGSASTLSVRYGVSDRRLFETFAGPAFSAVPGYGNDVARRGQLLVFGQTHVLSPAFVNDVRVAWGQVSRRVHPESRTDRLNRSVGLPEPWPNPRDAGLSFITVSGFSPLGGEYNNPQESTIHTWQVADTATWTRGDHLVKVGADVRGIRQRAFRDVQARGFLNFADQGITGNALADLLLGLPVLTGIARLDNPQHLRSETVALFVQDGWRVRPDLTLSAGVRYEYISPAVDPADRATVYDPVRGDLVQVGTHGVPRAGYESDRNNLAPRAGLAWSLPRRSDLVLRGGYGIYYNRSALAPGEGLYFSAPYYDLDFHFPLPGLPLTLDDPFPAASPIVVPDSALAYQRDLRTPYQHHWSVSLQHEVGTLGTAEIAYVASRGRNLVRARDANQAPASPSPFNPRPDLRFADITLIESTARSRYDSLQARYQQRQAFGLSLLAAYTWSTSHDDASGFFPSAGDPNFPQDSNDPAAEWGRSAFDVRHRLSVSFSYDLPVGRHATGAWRAVAGDWQLTGVATLQSGRPFTVALPQELDNSNTGRSSLGFGSNDRPSQIGDPRLDSPSPDRWFDVAAFVLPPYGSFGSAGRNTVEGPGYANLNLALLKHVALGRGGRLQLRAEAFNVLNRANFNQPDNFFGSPTFGQVLSADSPRRIQLGARILF
jgi:hypothetical protein